MHSNARIGKQLVESAIISPSKVVNCKTIFLYQQIACDNFLSIASAYHVSTKYHCKNFTLGQYGDLTKFKGFLLVYIIQYNYGTVGIYSTFRIARFFNSRDPNGQI